jgi:hypothetical protein
MSVPLIFVIGLGIPTTILIVSLWFVVKSTQRNWLYAESLARSLGLIIEPAKISRFGTYDLSKAHGQLRGKPFELFNFTTGSGKSTQLWCGLCVTTKTNATLQFSISRRWFGVKSGLPPNLPPLVTGNLDFDRTWSLRSNRPDSLRSILLPEDHKRLITLHRRGMRGLVQLKKGALVFLEKGSFTRARNARFEEVAQLLCDLADRADLAASPRFEI